MTVATDEFGRFVADRMPAGPVSLRFGPTPGEGRSAVVTEWIPI